MENHRGNIVIVGVLDQPGSTNLYMAKAFEKAGFKVIPVNYRTIMANGGPNTLNQLLFRLAKDDPKLMLFSKFNGVDSMILGKVSQKVKTWFWFMDGNDTLTRVPECIRHVSLSEFASFTGLGVLNRVKKELGTGDGMFHIMEGIDPEVYRPTIVDQRFECDVGFIGTSNPERVHFLNVISNAGYTVAAYGSGFHKEVNGVHFNMACSGAKAMLALSAEYNTESYFSDRVFRYGACASFVVHKHAPGLEKYFGHQQDLVYFKDENSLLQLLDYYIKQDKVDERKVMKQNIYNKVTSRHTWDNVIEQICSIAQI
jgi:hypothetical protein